MYILYIFNQQHNGVTGVTGVFSFTSNIKYPRNYTRNIINFLKKIKIMKVNYVMQTCQQFCCKCCIKMSLTLFMGRSDRLSQCRELEAYPLQNLYKSNWKKVWMLPKLHRPLLPFWVFSEDLRINLLYSSSENTIKDELILL
jgi:hypothetical protein